MAIPDEVAQYAEGRRITSYFSLGEVQDGDLKKHDWLWTTISDGNYPWDYDSFRVFIWSVRRHRFETAYIERKVKGYFPVRMLKQAQLGSAVSARGTAASATWPGFEVCVEKADGQRYWRTYAFIVNIVRFAGERPCEMKPPAAQPAPRTPAATIAASPVETTERDAASFLRRARMHIEALIARWRKR